MNIRSNFIQKCLFTMALLVPSLLYAQVTKECFKARVQTPEKKVMNMQLASSDTIPLSNLGTIYALSIDATIEQPREASFVRIVLEDTEGHNYLVAESDWFRNDTTIVQLSEYCEETAQLNGVMPLRLKCYLTNASLQLTGIHISSEMPKRGMMTKAELESVKTSQVQDVVDRINEYNVRHGKLWQAGATPYAVRSLEEQGEIGEDDAYLANMKYYAGGLYEIGERSMQTRSNYQSPYADSFDWSKRRHDKYWITKVKDQGGNGPCMIYAAVGVAEALTNLYFNDTINLDLSEYYVRLCTHFDQNGQYGGLGEYRHFYPMNFIKTDSVIDEYSAMNPNAYWDPDTSRPYGIESIRFHDIITVSPSGLTMDAFNDSIKKHLLHDGPASWGCNFPGNSSYATHFMTLVGYGTTKVGDAYYIITNNSSNPVFIDSSMAGKTYWRFKNSFGPLPQPQFMDLVINDSSNLYPAYFAKVPVTRRGHNDREIKCMDLDGDGYYNWGISKTPPITLPGWAFSERDADDADATIGALYDNGDVEEVGIDPYPWNITNTTTINSPTFNRCDIYVKSGGKLVVTNELRCLPGVVIEVESGGTLEIQGGKVVNVYFAMESGATLIIRNYGELRLLPDSTYFFEVPQGAIFEFESGNISKSNLKFWNP